MQGYVCQFVLAKITTYHATLVKNICVQSELRITLFGMTFGAAVVFVYIAS